MRLPRRVLACLAPVVLVAGLASPAEAGAIVPGFSTSTLAANDDGSTGLVPIGFAIDYFGSGYTNLYVNNNGNVTFTGPLATFTPFGLLSTATPIIAPFFADIDTRLAGDLVSYGSGTYDGHTAFGVNWVNVDYYLASALHTNRNSIQLIIVDRSDVAPGDFDFIFNYDLIQWEAGQASGSDAQGCGGSTARVGWSNGSTTAFELPGSDVDGAFLDSGTCLGGGPAGPNALIFNSLNSDVLGRYTFSVRNGEVVQPAVPEPGSLLLLGTGLFGLLRHRRRRVRT